MKRTLLGILLLALSGLIWLSLHLAGHRIYQVDECQNVYVARLVATGQTETAFTSISLFLLPFIWLARGAARAADLFVSARFIMVEVFWLNLVLTALATGKRLFSLGGLVALMGAATLVPLWDYGLEIRHDNVLLSGLLLLWCLLRIRPVGLQSCFVAGCLVVGLQFVAFKAIVYTLPISLGILLFPPPDCRKPRWQLFCAWTAGSLATFLILRLTYGAMGLWEPYVKGVGWVSELSAAGARFTPWNTLQRLLGQTPLLLAGTVAALAGVLVDLCRRGRSALSWEGCVPETILMLVAFGALIINPTPFPYNLLNLVPFMYLLLFRYLSRFALELWDQPSLRPMLLGILLFCHVVPFGVATQRHLDQTNVRQERLMSFAERLTDPPADPVYDGVGLVPTRSSIHFNWFLHSLNIESFLEGPGPRVHEMLAARPAAVFIPNYRTDWLTAEDHRFIRERYVALADDFWVLGQVLPQGGGSFEIVHPGRYRLATLSGSDLDGTYPEGWGAIMEPYEVGDFPGVLDGAAFTNQVVYLTAGTHRIEAPADCQTTVVWMGPRLDRIGRMGTGDHRRLFINWY